VATPKRKLLFQKNYSRRAQNAKESTMTYFFVGTFLKKTLGLIATGITVCKNSLGGVV